MALELNIAEQARMQVAQSAETMATTVFWKMLMKALAVDEANVLAELDKYLATESHPDREEVMTLCLKWHARRAHRRLLEDNVSQARDFRKVLRDQVLQQFMDNPEQPVSEEVAGILLESEM
jgi:hypothetical protein